MNNESVIKTAYDMVIEQFANNSRDTLSELVNTPQTLQVVKMVSKVTRALKGGLLEGQFKTNKAGLIIIRKDGDKEIVSSFKGSDYTSADKVNQELAADVLSGMPDIVKILDDVAALQKAMTPTLPDSLIKLIQKEFICDKEECVLSPLSHYRLLTAIMNKGTDNAANVARISEAAKEFKRVVYQKHLIKEEIRGKSDAVIRSITVELAAGCDGVKNHKQLAAQWGI